MAAQILYCIKTKFYKNNVLFNETFNIFTNTLLHWIQIVGFLKKMLYQIVSFSISVKIGSYKCIMYLNSYEFQIFKQFYILK